MSVHVALILLAVLSVAGQLFYLRARYRAKKIADLTSATNILASWPYTADQWRQASEEEFTWARGRGGAGRVYISPDTVYVKGDARERLIDLAGDGRVVTHASYGGGD